MNHIKIEGGVKICLFIILVIQLFFLHGIYLFIGMLIFFGGLYYLQQPFKSSVFTIIFIYHFLQIIAGVWQPSYLGYDMNYRAYSMELATIVSYAGLIILFIPIIYYQNKIPKVNLET